MEGLIIAPSKKSGLLLDASLVLDKVPVNLRAFSAEISSESISVQTYSVMTIFCSGDWTLSPPPFMPSLYALFLGLAHRGISIELGKPCTDEHVRRMIEACPCRDSVMIVLRLSILRLVKKNAPIRQNRDPQCTKAGKSTEYRLITPMQKRGC